MVAPFIVTILLIVLAMLIGAIIGVYKAKKVEMTAMPELVALLLFVGATAVIVGFNSFILESGQKILSSATLVEIYLGIFIGAVT